MTSDKKSPASGIAHGSHQGAKASDQPEWANGLKQLYDAVVDEPLPDSFKDLLAQLDDGDTGDASQSDRN